MKCHTIHGATQGHPSRTVQRQQRQARLRRKSHANHSTFSHAEAAEQRPQRRLASPSAASSLVATQGAATTIYKAAIIYKAGGGQGG